MRAQRQPLPRAGRPPTTTRGARAEGVQMQLLRGSGRSDDGQPDLSRGHSLLADYLDGAGAVLAAAVRGAHERSRAHARARR